QTLGGPLGLAVIGAVATSKTLSLDGITGGASDMSSEQLWALGQGYTYALLWCAGAAVIAGIAAIFIRYSPQEVAQAQEAQEAASQL
ncbi:MAG: MFS transporter, partial [Mycobacteriaceae bacterium]